MEKRLIDLQNGEEAIVIGAEGGYELINRLELIGIRKDKPIKKISSIIFHGPITVQIDNMQIAIGYGMAKKILVRKG